MNTIKTELLLITGSVQGVGYRWWMVQAAERLGVDGWVRNRRDGSVEAFVRGPAVAVDALAEWAHRGPPAARVVQVLRTPAEDDPSVTRDFAERPTV
ncbi:acylphosphatase [Niveibacterium sp. 24ML]|uniref:acylphosphatase n=1 Tax=Niveibacterium sp. 24ML TaxID=2985512 RepID=UPI0022708FFC|nr:acylphosphatase [Niveibacterium sp. 24ML]MCX9155035.1 acylphosphatase [Niveibacterium sp. 24ML]